MDTISQIEKPTIQKLIPSWLTNGWGIVSAFAALYLLLYISWTIFHWGANEGSLLIPQWGVDKNFAMISDLFTQPIELFALVTAWWIAFNRAFNTRLRRAWFILGLAVAAQFIADSMWFYLEVILEQQPWPSVADIFYLSFYPFALWGLLTLPGDPFRSGERVRVLLDLAIVMVAAWMVTWFFIISPTTSQYETGQLEQLLVAAYPIGDLVVLGGASVMLFRKTTDAIRSMLLYYLAGLLLFVTADLAYAYTTLTETYVSGGWIDVCWFAAYFFFGLAALRQAYKTETTTANDLSTRFFTGSTVVLPFAAICLGYGMLIFAASEGSSFNSADQGLFIGAGLLTIFVVGRQAAVAGQNAQLFREAEQLRISSEQANRAKSTFMANMSHELRTPLNAIIGFTRIVRRKAEGVLPEKQTENLDKVLSSAEHLLGLINTVLDIAKIEAGRMDVHASSFNTTAIVDQCVNLATPLLKPNVVLEKQVNEGVGIIHSDQDKIKQIVLNLLSNAAKFTHEGRITLRVEKTGPNIQIHVTDSGIGISEEALGRVFEEFQQADSETTRQYGGTGLGLAISRNLARLLGGDLTVTSTLGKGSTFTLTIPIQYEGKTSSPTKPEPESTPKAESQPKASSAKKLILVIDDDPDAVYLLQENLGSNEFEVIGERNGLLGHKRAQELKPHAILLDVVMPGKDGWQVLHDLKMDETTKNIPVILLTIIDKKALGFKLGASAYLLKPFDPSAVIAALKRVTVKEDGKPIQVLVVDDDPHVSGMLDQILPHSEFTLASASDGMEGLESIQRSRPDVVLLDLMMPRLDGFGVIEQLRGSSVTQDLPVIVISAKELTEEESKKLKESVTFVMQKQGLDGEKLVREINMALSMERSSR